MSPLMDKEFNEHDPRWQVRLLAQRVDALTREKEEIEKTCRDLGTRLVELEKIYQRGTGILLFLPFVGAAVGLMMAYGRVLLKPWTGEGK